MAAPVRRQYQIFIDRPPQAVFDFHASPKNLARLSPEDTPEEPVEGADGAAAEALAVGYRWSFRTRRGGAVKQTITVEIIEWNPPLGFAERQVSGPFATWVHRRKFTPFQAGTLVSDQIEYQPAAGPLGAVAERLWLGAQLDALFQHRQKEAKRLLEQIGRIKSHEARGETAP